ncbi:hypothetical protein ACHQM5_006432 [Ranunculus cassubicifolius]
MSKRSRKQKKNREESENYGTLRVFPEEIVLNILSRLPFDTVFNCKLVSKYWQTLIALPSFAAMHLSFHRKLLRLDDDDNTAAAAVAVNGGNVSLGVLFSIHFTNYDRFKFGAYYGDYHENKPFSYTSKSMSLLNHPQLNNNKSESYEIVGSCNGLVCYHVPFTEKHAFYVCNHMTKEFVYLVDDKRHYWGEDTPKYISGFGYVQSSNEYKIVRINTVGGKIQVFTLGTDRRGWRDKGKIKGEWLLRSNYYKFKVGMLANGALHWLDYATMKIMAFDLAKEEFHQVQSPPCFLPLGSDKEKDHFQLRVLGRFLCVVHLKLRNGVDIWSLKKIDQCWSWNKDVFHVQLCSYDPNTAIITQLVEDNQVSSILKFEAIPHINSFISLKALGVENCKQRKKYQRKVGR